MIRISCSVNENSLKEPFWTTLPNRGSTESLNIREKAMGSFKGSQPGHGGIPFLNFMAHRRQALNHPSAAENLKIKLPDQYQNLNDGESYLEIISYFRLIIRFASDKPDYTEHSAMG